MRQCMRGTPAIGAIPPHPNVITRLSKPPCRFLTQATESSIPSPAEYFAVVGIDLGTTNSAVAVRFFE